MAELPKATGWQEINPDTLPAQEAKLYRSYKDRQAHASEARKAFESATSATLKAEGAIPTGKEVVFGHRFGKLSFGYADRTAAKRDKYNFGKK